MKKILKTLILASLVLFAGTTLFLSCTHDTGGISAGGYEADDEGNYHPKEYPTNGIEPSE
jgi:hypothetical protein